jgi:hypothetical protein
MMDHDVENYFNSLTFYVSLQIIICSVQEVNMEVWLSLYLFFFH